MNDEKIWLETEDGQKLLIIKSEKCDMQKELNKTIDKLYQELQRKDNIINELKKLAENELPYLYEIDKEYENIEGNTYFTYKEYDYKKILDKINELEKGR